MRNCLNDTCLMSTSLIDSGCEMHSHGNTTTTGHRIHVGSDHVSPVGFHLVIRPPKRHNFWMHGSAKHEGEAIGMEATARDDMPRSDRIYGT
jgi:hypothetical protein